ncbi:STAND family AAA ATPase [Thiothrix subterranea]|uniref:STAND family AAA ATPase n=1 Tax=Thiothrix subterranea TaxID=2735563 RepID=UPI00280B5FA5|nr:hypothetical protein [Thiothrix subterranea]
MKYLFKEFLKKGLLPIYVDAKNISNSDPNSFVNKELSKQYSNLSFDEFDVFLDKVLLLDNFSSIGLNEKFQNVFIESISKKYDWVVVTCDSSFSYISSELPAFSKYREAKILGFGNSKREILVKKWVSLGVEESISDIDLYSEIDGLKNQINIVIKKNIVPPKPIYILIMMQMLDANTQRSLELTSYGHCYQYLIYQAFEKAKIDARNQEKYLNVLTELSWAIFKNKGGLNEFKLNYFFNDYGGKYLSVDKNDVIEKLICNSILTRNNGVVDFKYPYIYYFFMGKKIAEGFLECEDVKYEVDYLLENLYKEDCANILIFITHHTKNSWVLTKINEVLMNLFQDQPRAVLRKDQLLFMDSFVRLIPELVLEKREIQKERDKHNKRLDEIERKKKAFMTTLLIYYQM